MQFPGTLNDGWGLVEFGEGNKQQRSILLPERDLTVGRAAEADISIPSGSVSKSHARVTFEQGQMVVEDLGSTNGTYLNGARIHSSVVADGDLLQFANAIFKVGRVRSASSEGTVEEGILPWVQTLLTFDRLITDRAVVPHFQPIVTMDRLRTTGYEVLARSTIAGLSNPAMMFGAAERLSQQATLSEIMREEGLKVAEQSEHHGANFYLNTHPCEVMNDRFIESLQSLREQFPQARITIEIHEGVITNPASIATLRSLLTELKMGLAYDDFGAGQGRLLELGEVPPDVLKFDMQLIRNIHLASANRQELIATLVNLACSLGSTPLAEGVENSGEHEACLQMGFKLGQGFFYGRPSKFD